MTNSENWIRMVKRAHPAWIPIIIGIPPQLVFEYGQDAVWELVSRHPFVFPGATRDDFSVDRSKLEPWERSDIVHVDSWGVHWQTTEDGMTGVAVHHPLESLDGIDDYLSSVPDPAIHNGWYACDWDAVEGRIARHLSDGGFFGAGASLRHGHTLLTLEYICGFTTLAVAMAEDDPRLRRLIDAVERFNLSIVERYLACKPERIGYPEDLGSQTNTLISPSMFRTFVKPSYQRLMRPAAEQGVLIHMHSDGWILSILDDLVECGVNILNVQDRVNGIRELRDAGAGRVAFDLDIDRQDLSVFGSHSQIREWIAECIGVLAEPEGGLMLRFEARPPVTLETLDLIAEEFERQSGIRDH